MCTVFMLSRAEQNVSIYILIAQQNEKLITEQTLISAIYMFNHTFNIFIRVCDLV